MTHTVTHDGGMRAKFKNILNQQHTSWHNVVRKIEGEGAGNATTKLSLSLQNPACFITDMKNTK
jgi:hypothetical protein